MSLRGRESCITKLVSFDCCGSSGRQLMSVFRDFDSYAFTFNEKLLMGLTRIENMFKFSAYIFSLININRYRSEIFWTILVIYETVSYLAISVIMINSAFVILNRRRNFLKQSPVFSNSQNSII